MLTDEEILKEFHKLLNFALAESKENSISDSMKFAAVRLYHAAQDEDELRKAGWIKPEDWSDEAVKYIKANVIPMNVQTALAWALAEGTPTILWNIAQTEGWVRKESTPTTFSEDDVELAAGWLAGNVNTFWTGKFNKQGGKIWDGRYSNYKNAGLINKEKARSLLSILNLKSESEVRERIINERNAAIAALGGFTSDNEVIAGWLESEEAAEFLREEIEKMAYRCTAPEAYRKDKNAWNNHEGGTKAVGGYVGKQIAAKLRGKKV